MNWMDKLEKKLGKYAIPHLIIFVLHSDYKVKVLIVIIDFSRGVIRLLRLVDSGINVNEKFLRKEYHDADNKNRD